MIIILDSVKLAQYKEQLKQTNVNSESANLTMLIQATSIYRHLIKYVHKYGTKTDQTYFQQLNERYKILYNDYVATTFVIKLFDFVDDKVSQKHFLDTISEINRDKGHLIQKYDDTWKQLRPLQSDEVIKVIDKLNNFICHYDLTAHNLERIDNHD